MPALQTPTGQIKFLDGMRGLAALYVVIGHARYLLWEGYGAYKQHSESYTKVGKATLYFFSLFRYGHEAVMFFFVLSGFVIHLKYARKIKVDSLTPFYFTDYFKRRAERLYPPLLFALLLTFILDSYGSSLGLQVYQGQTPYEAINQVNKNRSLVTLIGNLFWLQRTIVPEFGSNGPLWSLMYEWWFYMLYPVFFFINRRSTGAGMLSAILLCAGSFFLPFIPVVTQVMQAFILWYLGVLIADIYAGRLQVTSWWPGIGISLIPLVVLTEGKIEIGFGGDLLLALGFACLIYTNQLAFKKGRSFYCLNKLRWLGDCSYTLYVTHFPILFFCSGLLMKKFNGRLPTSQLYVLSGIIITIVFAFAVHFIIEKPFTKKRILQPAV